MSKDSNCYTQLPVDTEGRQERNRTDEVNQK